MPRQHSHHASFAAGACFASFAWAATAHAYRPFDGTDADVVEPGTIEVELGPVAYVDVPNGSIVEAPVLTINAGLWKRWELVIDATRATDRSSIDETTTVESAALIKGLLREGVLQGADGWSVATELGVLVPTHNADDDYGATVALIGSMQGQRATVHLNAAVSRNREGENELFGGIILEGGVDGPLRPVAEISYEAVNADESHAFSGLLGAIWESRDSLSFDVALRAIRAASAWSYEGRIGLTWQFAIGRS